MFERAFERASIDLKRILCITADNAGNNKTTVRALKDAITNAVQIIAKDLSSSDTTIIDPCQMVRNPCIAHVIQLGLKALIDKIKIQARNNKVITEWDEDASRREPEPPRGLAKINGGRQLLDTVAARKNQGGVRERVSSFGSHHIFSFAVQRCVERT